MQLKSETTSELWQRRTQINDIEFVDLTIMVDILVDSITTTELIVDGTREIHHILGHIVLVDNDNSILVTSYRSIRSTHARYLFFAIVSVLINTLIAESIDTTESCVQLYASQVRRIVTTIIT